MTEEITKEIRLSHEEVLEACRMYCLDRGVFSKEDSIRVEINDSSEMYTSVYAVLTTAVMKDVAQIS